MIAARAVNVTRPSLQSHLASAKPSVGPAVRARSPLLVRATASGGSTDELRKAGESLQKAAGAALGSAQQVAQQKAQQAADAVKNLKVPDMAKLDVDIRQTVTWNFLVQLALTAVSWAIAFFTSHTTMAKGAGVHPTTALLMIGVLLSGYSCYLSYTYLLKVKSSGLNVLQGWNQLKDFNDHLVVNFAGAAATLLALQAEVGLLMAAGMTKKAGGLAVEALAQASANTLTAHIVSIVFLTLMIRKVTAAYQRVLEWGENLSKSMPKLS